MGKEFNPLLEAFYRHELNPLLQEMPNLENGKMIQDMLNAVENLYEKSIRKTNFLKEYRNKYNNLKQILKT